MVLLGCLLDHSLPEEQVGEAQPTGDVGWIERCDPSEQIERLAPLALLAILLRGFLELSKRVGGEPLTLMKLTELNPRAHVSRVDSKDLLVDGSSFRVKPFLRELPGDLRIERPGFRLYIPITTCVVVSLVLSLALWLFSKLR